MYIEKTTIHIDAAISSQLTVIKYYYKGDDSNRLWSQDTLLRQAVPSKYSNTNTKPDNRRYIAINVY